MWTDKLHIVANSLHLVRTPCYLVLLHIKLVRSFWIHRSNEVLVCTVLSLHSAALVLFAPMEMKVLTHFRGRRRFLMLLLSAALSGTANQDTAACPSPASLKLLHHHSCPQLHTTVEQSTLHLPCILYDTFNYRLISMVCCVPGSSDSWMVPLFYLDIHQIDCRLHFWTYCTLIENDTLVCCAFSWCSNIMKL